MYEYIIDRTCFFDGVFMEALENKVPLIVLLRAGYDSRAYRYADQNQASKIFELDIVSTQSRKRKYLGKRKWGIPESVSFVPKDFNKEPLADVLDGAGFDSDKNTLFIWEGTIYYLKQEAMAATLEFAADCPNTKSRIAFDYAVRISEETMEPHYGVKEFTATWKKHRQSEPFQSAIDEGDIKTYLGQRGLQLLKNMNATDIEQTFLLNTNSALLGHITGLFGFAIATPKMRHPTSGH